MKMSRSEFLSQLMTRREAEQFVGLTNLAFQHHLRVKNILPCKVSGSGSGKVQLFWKSDLVELKKKLK